MIKQNTAQNFNKVLLFIILIFIFYRSPYILLNGRFIAEEGSFFFRNSYLFGPLEGLKQIIWSDSGYYNFWANISSIFASFVPLNYAPLVTVYFAFAVQLYLFIFIIFSQSDFIKTNTDRFVISFIVLLSPCMVAEVWLNTLTSQVYFTILTILIYFQRNLPNSFFCKFSSITLLLSGFSSLLPCVLSPFYIYKYLKNKIRFNFYNFIAITIPTIFQIIIYSYSKIQNLEIVDQNIRYIVSFDKVTNYTYNVLIKSFFGRELTQVVFYKFFNFFSLYILSFFIISLFVMIFVFLSKKIKNDNILYFLLSFFLLNSFLAIYASKVELVQGRYALIPGILLTFIFYRIFQISNSFPKILFGSFIIMSLSTGLYEFKTKNIYPEFLMCMNCPNWKKEVSKWENDNTYHLKIWMYGELGGPAGKTMNLIK